MPKRSISYQELLINQLKDPHDAVGYLNEILSEHSEDDEISQKVLLRGLNNVAQAQGGLKKLAQKNGLKREDLCETLSKSGNPQLSTLNKIARVLGLEVVFRVAESREIDPQESMEE